MSSTHSTSAMKPSDLEDQQMGGINQGMPVYQGSAMVKAGFIRKVYGILAAQLLLTVMSSAIFMFHDSTRAYVLATPSMMMTASILPFGFLLGLFCYKDKHPVNMYLLGAHKSPSQGFDLCATPGGPRPWPPMPTDGVLTTPSLPPSTAWPLRRLHSLHVVYGGCGLRGIL